MNFTSEKTENGQYISVADGNKSATIYVSALAVPLPVAVCQTSNASHKAWGGHGKNFASLEAALAAYKSSFMKAAIQQAAALINA